MYFLPLSSPQKALLRGPGRQKKPGSAEISQEEADVEVNVQHTTEEDNNTHETDLIRSPKPNKGPHTESTSFRFLEAPPSSGIISRAFQVSGIPARSLVMMVIKHVCRRPPMLLITSLQHYALQLGPFLLLCTFAEPMDIFHTLHQRPGSPHIPDPPCICFQPRQLPQQHPQNA